MRTKAVFIDALGTMLWLQPPWQRIDPAAVEGIPIERVRDAFIAEISYYMPRSGEGRDPQSLAELRERCAAVLSSELGREVSVETMLAALSFNAFDDTAPALSELRGLGLKVVCVSNWDCSLPGLLAELGLTDRLDGVVTSAAAGVRKPDPGIFAPALELAGCSPEQALHVGDTGDDVAAAEAAGIRPLLIDRSETRNEATPAATGRCLRGTIASLGEIVEHLRP